MRYEATFHEEHQDALTDRNSATYTITIKLTDYPKSGNIQQYIWKNFQNIRKNMASSGALKILMSILGHVTLISAWIYNSKFLTSGILLITSFFLHVAIMFLSLSPNVFGNLQTKGLLVEIKYRNPNHHIFCVGLLLCCEATFF